MRGTTSPAAIASAPEDALEARSEYLPWLDGLRAVAVLAVVLYHLDPAWLPGGFTGVDVFFVISGFVVCAASARATPTGPGGFAAWFYARRLRRLAPALVACLLVTGLASALLVPPAWLSESAHRAGFAAFFGLGNVVLASASGDYFAPTAEFNPYTHTWSLAVEEQFYLLFPLLFWPWLRAHRGWSIALFALALAGSLGLALHWALVGETAAAFYLLPARGWELAAGVLLYFALARRATDARPLRFAPALAWLSLAALLWALLHARPGQVPWPDALPAVVGTLGLIAAFRLGAGGALRALLASAPMQAIGRGSYSLYLWHWPVFVLMRWTTGLDTPALKLAGLGLAAALAAASYRWIERPLRYAPAIARLPRARVVVIGVVLLLGGAASFYAVHKARPWLSLTAVVRAEADWLPEHFSDPVRPDCEVDRVVVQREPYRAWRFEASGCAAPAPRRRLFVLGDSHALAYTALFKQLVADGRADVRILQREGCPFIDLLGHRDVDDPACAAGLSAALDAVAAQAGGGDVLFLPSLRVPRLSEQWRTVDRAAAQAGVQDGQAESVRSRAEAAAVERLAMLAQRGVRIVLEAPKPVLPAPPFRCVDAFNRGNPVCAGGLSIERDAMDALRAPALASLQRIAARLPDAGVWDPLPLLCDADACRAMRDGRPLFVDGDHLSGHANRLLRVDFERQVLAIDAAP